MINIFRVGTRHLLLILRTCADNVILLLSQSTLPIIYRKVVTLRTVKWNAALCWAIESTVVEPPEDFLPVDSIFLNYYNDSVYIYI